MSPSIKVEYHTCPSRSQALPSAAVTTNSGHGLGSSKCHQTLWFRSGSRLWVSKTARGWRSASNPAVLTTAPCVPDPAAPPAWTLGDWGPYLNHLREIPSISQLQDYVELVVFDERIQILDDVGVVQLLQGEGMQEEHQNLVMATAPAPPVTHKYSLRMHPQPELLCCRQNPVRISISHRHSSLEMSLAKSNSTQHSETISSIGNC